VTEDEPNAAACDDEEEEEDKDEDDAERLLSGEAFGNAVGSVSKRILRTLR
jgi:hypothetical protein